MALLFLSRFWPIWHVFHTFWYPHLFIRGVFLCTRSLDKTFLVDLLVWIKKSWNVMKIPISYSNHNLKKSANFHYSKHNLTFKNSTMKMNFHSEFKVEKLHTTKGCTCTLSTLVLSVKRHDATHRYATVTLWTKIKNSVRKLFMENGRVLYSI